jgi:hypothetical protein
MNMSSPETNPFLAIAPAVLPAKSAPHAGISLRTVIGAGGDQIDYRRAGVLFLALCGAWITGSAFYLLLSHRAFQPGFWLDWISSLLDCVVLTAAIVLSFRHVRNGALATLVTAAAMTLVMVPVDWVITVAHNRLAGPGTTWSIDVVPAVISHFGHVFLMILALDLALTNVRTFWIALGVGGVAGRLVAGWFGQTVFLVFFGLQQGHQSFVNFSFIFNQLLTTTAAGLLTGMIFSLIFFGGFKYLGGLATLPTEALATDGAARNGTGSIAAFRAAAAYRTAVRSLRAAGIASIIFGLIALGLGIASMNDSPVNAFLAFLGLVLLVEGIWLVSAPSPAGMIVDGFALIALGIWNIFVTVHNASSGASSSGSFALMGLWQIVWGFQSFGRYHRLRQTCLIPPSPEDLTQIDRVLQELRLPPAGSEGMIEFEAKGGPHKRWKARLLPDLAVFVCGKEAQIVIATRDEIKITPSEGVPTRARNPRTLIELGTHKLNASISPDALACLQCWQATPTA